MIQGNLAVLGAGGWGIAISNLLADKGYGPKLWEFDPVACDKLKSTRQLPSKLPGITINADVSITNDLAVGVSDADMIICVVPSQTLRATVNRIAGIKLSRKPIIVNLAKGIEVGTLKRMSEVIQETMPSNSLSGIATLSGPSHAEEVARNMPTAVVVASESDAVAKSVQELFKTPRFRVYTSTDITGVELAGSLKNIIALAAGMLDGLGLGDNTKGALLTRGLSEIVRMGVKMGADPMTFSGLSGIGDLITTCLSHHSRNRFVGEQIGKGRKLKDILSHMAMVAEGVETTKSGYELSRKYGVEMPITVEVFKVLFEDKPPSEAINDLMTREPKPERLI